MSYVVRGIDPAPYRHLFGLSDEDWRDKASFG